MRTALIRAIVASTAPWLLLSMLGTGFWAGACHKSEKPPALPLTQTFNRIVPRTELVPLVVHDPARAARVRALHIEIEQLLLNAAKVQSQKLSRLQMQGGRDPSDEEVRAIVDDHKADGRETLKSYVELQMQLREQTTAEEFQRLSAAR